MRKRSKNVIAIVLTIALTASVFPIKEAKNEVLAESVTLQNPRIIADSSMEDSGQKVTWDCVWFGSYPQAEIIPSGEYTALDSSLLEDGDTIVSDALYSKLQSAIGWDANGDITIEENKYRRVKQSDVTYGNESNATNWYNWLDSTTYHYFKYEPIKWRVLKVDGNDAFLLADKGLDNQLYNEEYVSITWETSTIRSWLNGYDASFNICGNDYSSNNFMDVAFSNSEQSAINATTVVNDDNLGFGTDGGNNTNDKVFFLSESEAYTDNALLYGFVSENYINDEARRSKSSTYTKAMGAWSEMADCHWWLRSPGNVSTIASFVYNNGFVYGHGGDVDGTCTAVRPALHLNLSLSNLYSYAGTVCSDGTVNKEERESTSANPEKTTVNDTTASETTVDNETTIEKISKEENNVVTTISIKENEVVENSKVTKIKKIIKKKKSLKVTWKKVKNISGYQLQYSTSKNFKKAKKITIKKAKTTTKTIKKLKAKKKYYIRIRTYITIDGKKIWSKWSKAKSVITK